MVEGVTKVFPNHELYELDLTAAVLTVLKDESIPKMWLSGAECFKGCEFNR